MNHHNQLLLSLYKIGVIKFGHFTLKSGQTSLIYIDLRQIVSYPKILRDVAESLWNKIQDCHTDLLCGVPYTALPIATCISQISQIPMIMRRKEKKAYGTKQQIEGAYQAGQNCLIIEDIVTTGSSVLETAEDLNDVQLKITDVVVFIDREENGKQNLQKHNYQLHAVFTLSEILSSLMNSGVLTEPERDIVNQLILERA